MKEVNVAVVGAGIVGQEMLNVLAERNFPIGELRIFATEQSAGRQVTWQGQQIEVEDSAHSDFTNLDIVLMSAGSDASKHLAPHMVKSGAIVIDNSSAWRHDPKVPLVVAGVNNEALHDIPKGIIANPNCSTMLAMPVLYPLHERAGLKSMIATTFQAASGAGKAGIEELEIQTRQSFRQPAGQSDLKPQVFPEPIANNIVPLRGKLVGRNTDEELKLIHESKKILKIADLAVSATCCSVPVYIGHSLSIEAEFRKTIDPEAAEAILRDVLEVSLIDIPTPLKAEGGDITLVGRIRQSGVFGAHGLSFYLAGDNLRKGAALNAVQIAELIL